MSKSKQPTQISTHSFSKNATRAGSQPSLSSTRKWTFRFVAAVVVPVVLLGVLELGLRLAGFGYPTSFFLKEQVNGRPVWVENDRFGLRFFPPELARSPSPLVMEANKPKDLFRIFILGESAALGDPEPAFGFGRYLQVLLEDRFPQRRFEVICTAMTAINSHTVLPIARECANHEGDVWIVYMGNNEFVGPFGPSTVFGPQVPPSGLIRLGVALKKTRTGQLLYRIASRNSSLKTWGGMKMFQEHQVGPGDPRKAKVYDYFQSNLEGILASARRSGTKVILSTIAANLRDCPPFASQHSLALTDEQKARWQQLYDAATHAQADTNYPGAVSNYQAAAQLDSSFAELQFRWAQCLLAVTNIDEAKHHFELALDYDCLPFRADGRLNTIIQQAASRHSAEGVTFLDTASSLARQSPDGILGKESLYEHVHLNFDGNYWAARALAQTVAGLLPGSATNRQDWASLDYCAARLGLTDWDRHRVYESMFRRMMEPPFVNQLDHRDQMEAMGRTILAVRARQTPEGLQKARAIYQHAITNAPGDFYLRGGFAKLDEDTGDLAEAADQWRAVRDEIPFTPGPHFYLGRVLAREGKADDALQELSRALSIRPDLPDALEEKGRLLSKTDRFEEGLALLEKAARLEPGNPRICLDRAQALAAHGRRPEAIGQFQRAVRLQPASWEARFLLGIELAFDGNLEPAAEQFRETVRLNPSYPLGHLNLGIALAKLEKADEAMFQFQETLRLDPKNLKATEYLQELQQTKSRTNKAKP